jgi:hypothetical protein
MNLSYNIPTYCYDCETLTRGKYLVSDSHKVRSLNACDELNIGCSPPNKTSFKCVINPTFVNFIF